jgi:hypothetical protein
VPPHINAPGEHFSPTPVNFFPGKPTKRPDEQNLQEKSHVETFFDLGAHRG